MVLHQTEPARKVLIWRQVLQVMVRSLLELKQQLALAAPPVEVIISAAVFKVVLDQSRAILRRVQQPCGLALTAKAPGAREFIGPAEESVPGGGAVCPYKMLERLVSPRLVRVGFQLFDICS